MTKETLSDKIQKMKEEKEWIGNKYLLQNDVREFIKKIEKRIKLKLRRLGVRLDEKDKFDSIGVENAIYSSIQEIREEAGEKLT